jgi:hypothetical protein
MLGSQIKHKLFHISFEGNLNGFWHPRNPYGEDDASSAQYAEPDLPRISCAPSIEQCFQAIYPNISQYFEVENYPNLDFYVYTPVFRGFERILPPKYLTIHRYVHDAHLTDEYCILDPVYMQLIGKVRIQNTNNNPTLDYHPFDQIGNPKRFFAPTQLNVEWL